MQSYFISLCRIYWINYKLLKRKIKDIENERGAAGIASTENCHKSPLEKEFFLSVTSELKKISSFFDDAQKICKIRLERIRNSVQVLVDGGDSYVVENWDQLNQAIKNLLKDLTSLERYAVMNYCGISKILKKYDKRLHTKIRSKFMSKFMQSQNFTRYPELKEIRDELAKVEAEFNSKTPPLRFYLRTILITVI